MFLSYIDKYFSEIADITGVIFVIALVSQLVGVVFLFSNSKYFIFPKLATNKEEDDIKLLKAIGIGLLVFSLPTHMLVILKRQELIKYSMFYFIFIGIFLILIIYLKKHVNIYLNQKK